jgi:hypothetical protein
MTLDRAPRAVSEFEAYHRRLMADVGTLKSKLSGVADADLDTLVSSLGGQDKVDALSEAMPDQPSIAEMMTAMGGAEALGTFAEQTLGGNVEAMAVLADKGCKGDAKALADIAASFADEPETLGNMLSEGGLGEHPEAFAEVFAEGCGGDADKLLNFCQTFDSDSRRKSLRDALDQGGLGQAPAALGSLVKENDGKMLLKVAQEADMDALNDMLLTGGMGGEPPDHPDTLKSVLVEALGGDPKRLKELHDAFPHDGDGMPQMQAFFQALNGGLVDGDATVGKKMDALMKSFQKSDPALTPEELVKMLYDPYFLEASKA